jgi:hypothetical protein
VRAAALASPRRGSKAASAQAVSQRIDLGSAVNLGQVSAASAASGVGTVVTTPGILELIDRRRQRVVEERLA